MQITKLFRNLFIPKREVIVEVSDDSESQKIIDRLEQQLIQFAKDYIELETELSKACKQISELEDIAEAAGNIWAGRAAREKLASLIANYNIKKR
jgi:hypothetical protein